MFDSNYNKLAKKIQDTAIKKLKEAAKAIINRLKKNLPEVIASSARFFRVGSDKVPHQKEWSKSENQLSLDKLDLWAGECVGFCTNGTPDFALLDFDHIFNKEGDYVNDTTRLFVEDIKSFFPKAYAEKSISDRGLHIFLLPSKKFKRAAPYVVNLGDGAKLEIFYRTKGRYCLVTGKTLEPENKEVPAGECADNFLAIWLKEEETTENTGNLFAVETTTTVNQSAVETTTASNPLTVECADNSARKAENNDTFTRQVTGVVPTRYDGIDKKYDAARAMRMLKMIEPDKLNDTEWLAVMTVCKNLHIAADIIDEFNKRDPSRYDVEGNEKRIESLNDSSYGIQNLHAIAKRFGYNEKDFFAEYQQSRRTTEKECDVYSNLDSAKREVAKFEEECMQAMSLLESVKVFDIGTLFSQEVVHAAACAKLFDKELFAIFKKRIKESRGDNGVSLTDWAPAVTEDFNALKSYYVSLKGELTKAEAAVTNTEFVGANDILKGFKAPGEFAIDNTGIYKLIPTKEGLKLVPITSRPIVITQARYSIAEKHLYYTLWYKTMGKWWKIPPQSAAVVFDARKIIELVKMGLPIDSTKGAGLVDFLRKWQLENERVITAEYVSKTGYQDFDANTCIFVDPRLNLKYNDKPVVVEENSFTDLLKTKGNFTEWIQKVFGAISLSDIATFLLGAALSTPLLKILGERNFVVYVYGNTRAGKSTALIAAMSAIGNEKLIKSFDSTINGLVGLAAESNDYPIAVDEKQNVDGKLSDSLTRLVYAIANGTGRLKLNKDSSLRQVQYWRTILLCNGEVPLVEENVTGGTYSRLMQIHLKEEIFSSEQCRNLRHIVKDCYGSVFPKIIEVLNSKPADFWQNKFRTLTEKLTEQFPDIISEYCRYAAIVSITLEILWGWYLENVPIKDTNAVDAAKETAEFILKAMPTIDSISDTQRQWDILSGFIAQNQRLFIQQQPPQSQQPPEFGGTEGGNDIAKLPAIYGVIDFGKVFITTAAITECCKKYGLNKTKLINDMFDSGKFTPYCVEKGKTRLSGKKKRIGSFVTRVFELSEQISVPYEDYEEDSDESPSSMNFDPDYAFEESD